jgi:hypothetical protein
MINLSANVQNLLQENLISIFLLLKIYERNIDTNVVTVIKALTTNSYDLTMSNGQTYLSNGQILSVDPPAVSTTVGRDIFKIRLADPGFIEGQYADAGYIGKSVELRIGFLDRATQSAIVNINDTFISYAGKIEGTAYQVNLEALGEASLEISCSNPMADLDYTKSLFTGKEFVRSRNPLDASCDEVFASSGALGLKWGKT